MSVTDPIADAITKIRNAYQARHRAVRVNHSKIVEAVVRILAEENYINNYTVVERETAKKIYRRQIQVNLRYTNEGVPIIRGLQRVSRPGLRVYINADNIPSVFNNTGCAVISTNRGVMTDRQARAGRVGGEYICKIW